MKARNTITLVLFFIVTMGWTQTVSLPDTNLRNKLLADYPQVMQGNDLDISQAQQLTGELDLSNANIYDATGIEHFIAITTLNIKNNQLTTLPDLSASTEISFLFASYNQLQTFPDLSALNKLIDFQVMNNRLSQLPNLPAGNNLITIYANNNELTQLPDLSQFPNLSILAIGNNPLESTVDYSVCPNLTQLHIHQTNADTIIGLGQLSQLNTLYAWGNQIRDFSSLDNNINLVKLTIFDNPINSLPKLDNKPFLNEVTVNQCNLTFENIWLVVQQNPTFTFNYVPQRALEISHSSAREKGNVTFQYPESSPLASNTYVWYKNDVKIDSSSSPTLSIDTLQYSDEGDYQLKVYNADIAGLVLESNVFTLTVLPCIEFSLPMVDVLDKDCSEGYTLDLGNAVILGGTSPYTYSLENETFYANYSSEIIEGAPAGKYQITITDAQNCSASSSLTLNRIEGCDPVLTPNGDGIGDTYFIDHQGTITIYDLRRNEVKTLQGPSAWDGTNNTGNLVDAGYYFVILEGQETPLYISVIR